MSDKLSTIDVGIEEGLVLIIALGDIQKTLKP